MGCTPALFSIPPIWHCHREKVNLSVNQLYHINMSKIDVLLGLQWGDEGKGKVVDFLTPQYDMIARFQGGPNAGHTLIFEGEKYVLRSIPSGIFQGGKQNVIGNGVVLDPILFRLEVEELKKSGHDLYDRLLISRKAHLIMPTHRYLDAANEQLKGDSKVGTTGKGIGPTYTDKIGRFGLRVGDIEGDFLHKYQTAKERHLALLAALDYQPEGLDALEKEWLEAVEYLKQFRFVDSEFVINRALDEDKKLLAEGAQGSMLDIDFGSYPFVTSSNTVCAGSCTGLGIAPSRIGEVFGIFKAYCTRVGAGPFPTELFDEVGEEICQRGGEFGSVTGRKRRTGWLDLVALRYTVMLNGVTQLIMMKSDVLDTFEEIKICTAYRKGDEIVTDFPYYYTDEYEPVYQSFKGWQQDCSELRSYDALPEALQQYISFIEQEVGVPVKVVSVGPDRAQTIIR